MSSIHMADDRSLKALVPSLGGMSICAVSAAAPSVRPVVHAMLLLALPAAALAACPPWTAEAAAALAFPAAMARAAACHPEALAAEAAVAAAAADARTAGQGANPQLTLGAGSFSR